MAGGVALFAALVSALAVVQPVEAQLSCPDRDVGCLIDKIREANGRGRWTSIELGEGPYSLPGRSDYAADGYNALPSITGSVSIHGVGAGATSIERPCPSRNAAGECSGADVRIFHVAPGGTLELWNVSVRNGKANSGGGIYNEGSLELRGTSIVANHAHFDGAGIYSSGWVYLQDSTINNNGAHLNGASRGGGIFIASGVVDIAYSTINHNQATYGGGINNFGGGLNIWNSTISTNRAVGGSSNKTNAGGILNGGSAEAWLKSVTITANHANPVSSSYAGGVHGGGALYVSNTIMAGNMVGYGDLWLGNPRDCSGEAVTLGGNLVGDPGLPSGSKSDGTPRYPCDIQPWTPWPSEWPSQAGDQIGRITTPPDSQGVRWPIYAKDVFVMSKQGSHPLAYAPKLADNCGTSCTHALCKSLQPTGPEYYHYGCANPSPAIDRAWTGKPGAHPMACEAYDQRWAKRGSRCDIGAFEYGKSAPRIGLGCSGY
jgi:hypothetical protein